MENSDSDEENLPPLVLTKELWQKRLQNIEVFGSDIHRVLMNYFSVNGFEEVARQFSVEANNVQPEIPLESIGVRRQIREAVLNGDMETAIELLNGIDRRILQNNPEINFLLKQQQLLSILEKEECLRGIQFAQKELGPCVLQHENLLPKLEEVMTLIAFPNLKNDETAQKLLCNMDQKLATAQRIDNATLEFFNVSNVHGH